MIDQIAGKTGWLVWMLHTSDNKAKIHDVVKNAEGQNDEKLSFFIFKKLISHSRAHATKERMNYYCNRCKKGIIASILLVYLYIITIL